jgi:hypothetical protein
MPDEDAIKRLEARLTRVEAALAQFGGRPHPIVDPAAFAGAGRWPGPVVDPTPWPQPVVDPLPWPYPIVDPVPWPRPVVDPATYATAAQSRAAAAAALGRVGTIGDPPPIDISRFSIAQLEATLHSINAERARLTSIETMVTQQLNKLKEQQD